MERGREFLGRRWWSRRFNEYGLGYIDSFINSTKELTLLFLVQKRYIEGVQTQRSGYIVG
jgi:hypothetical protein